MSDHNSDSGSDVDVDEQGLQRLMTALGEDGLNDFDVAALAALRGEDEGSEDEESEDGDEEDEDDGEIMEFGDDGEVTAVRDADEAEDDDDDEEADNDEEEDEDEDEEDGDGEEDDEDEEDKKGEEDNEDEDEQEEEEEEEGDSEEGIDIEDMEEVPEDAILRQKVKINNQVVLQRLYEQMKLDVPFVETHVLSYPEDLAIKDAENDLERELAFYKQSLWAAEEGRKRYAAASLPFSRPEDFFAEMVKSDEHMERVRQRLLDERAGMKASEEARRQRDLKKFGKKVQTEKLKERDRSKKEMKERVNALKRKREGGLKADGGDDDFDVQLENAIADRPKKRGRDAGAGSGGRSKMSRAKRDEKYGGRKGAKRAKENTRESTEGFGEGLRKGNKGGGGKFGGGGKAKPKARPGKSKRVAGRGK